MSVSADDLHNALQEVIEENQQKLESMTPQKGVNQFLKQKETDVRSQTIAEYRRKLNHFLDFCEIEEIDNLNELNGRIVNDFKEYRRTESASQTEPLSSKTMRDDMYLFREFIGFLANIEAVSSDLQKKVSIPKMKKGDGIRDIDINSERVEKILTHLKKYDYASRAHVIWVLHVHTGRRPGGLYAIDLQDLFLDCDDPHIQIRHRECETELKNGKDGETEVHITDRVAQVIQDYIQNNRTKITTENGREPLLTSIHGRLSKTTMRKCIYKYTRPCAISGECPHDRDIDSCEATKTVDAASKCPSSRPPYALRHGYITSQLRNGTPAEIVSGRCDVSEKVIDKHYDERDEEEKRKLRQKVFEEIRKEQDEGGYL